MVWVNIFNLALVESQLQLANKKKDADQDNYSDMQARVNNLSEKLAIAKQENHELMIQLDLEKSHGQNLEETRKK